MLGEKKIERLWQLLREIEEVEERLQGAEHSTTEEVVQTDYLNTLKAQYNELFKSTFPT